VQRPGWAMLTMLGTVLQDTTVTVEDNGPANDVAAPDTNPAIGFPADADAIAGHIDGVAAAGVWWPVSLPAGTSVTGSLALSAAAAQTVNLLAASPGAVQAMGLTMVVGSPLSRYENDTSQHVAMIDTTTATELGISPARLASHPAVFVDGIAYTLAGIYSSAQRVVTDESAMLIPENTALADFGNPEPGIGNQDEA
jgi:putative ABC transport system permease protein